MIEEKLNKMIKSEKGKKKTENLIIILIILIISVITINILFSGKKDTNQDNSVQKVLAKQNDEEITTNNIEGSLINILSKIEGVGNVEVLVTFSETSSIVPLYNQKSVKSTTEETDNNGGTRTIENINEDKEVISGQNSEPVTEKVVMPKFEGAIIAAEGADNSVVKSNIISAVEAATGIPNYKIQVFKMK